MPKYISIPLERAYTQLRETSKNCPKCGAHPNKFEIRHFSQEDGGEVWCEDCNGFVKMFEVQEQDQGRRAA